MRHFRAAQGLVEPPARGRRKERKEPFVSALPIQNEVDGENDPGDNTDQSSGPVLRMESNSCVAAVLAKSLNAVDDLVRIQLRNKG